MNKTQLTLRVLDIFLAIIFLVPASPLLLSLWILLRLSGVSHPIYKSIRVGRKSQHFLMPKFRTMHIDTPQISTDLLDMPEQRYVRFGRTLRKLSLDEVPQLFSVLRGEMSLVGPRPALYNQYKLIEMRKNNSVDCIRPGLTGLAQISGRDNITESEKLNLDITYCQNASVGLYIKILFKTFLSIFHFSNVKH